jgi:hypothetical protein
MVARKHNKSGKGTQILSQKRGDYTEAQSFCQQLFTREKPTISYRYWRVVVMLIGLNNNTRNERV